MAAHLLHELPTGQLMPLVGLGTYRIRGSSVIFNVLDTALKAGYRSIDTAAVYNNEADIGASLRELLPRYGLTRQDIFLTSKLAPGDHRPDLVEGAVQKSLSQLGTTYLDLFLVHWPGASGITAADPNNPRLRRAAWRQLVALHKKGILRSIGVSNFTVRHLEELLQDCDGVKPVVNQVELHPHYPQRDLLAYCHKVGIFLQAYSSLGGTGNKNLVSDPVVVEVAKNCSRQPAQVLLRWALEQNIGIVPKAVTPSHIVDNLQLDFTLSENDMAKLNAISTVSKYAWNPEVVV